jgi:hypothetical protein
MEITRSVGRLYKEPANPKLTISGLLLLPSASSPLTYNEVNELPELSTSRMKASIWSGMAPYS